MESEERYRESEETYGGRFPGVYLTGWKGSLKLDFPERGKYKCLLFIIPDQKCLIKFEGYGIRWIEDNNLNLLILADVKARYGISKKKWNPKHHFKEKFGCLRMGKLDKRSISMGKMKKPVGIFTYEEIIRMARPNKLFYNILEEIFRWKEEEIKKD